MHVSEITKSAGGRTWLLEVKDKFREWRQSGDCPWYIKQQYLDANGRRARAGAGPAGKNAKEASMDTQDYDSKIATLLATQDFAGAAALQEIVF